MLELLAEYGLFLAKVVTLVLALLFILGSMASNATRSRDEERGHIQVRHLNERFKHVRDTLLEATLSEDAFKQEMKSREKEEKKDAKQAKKKKSKSESASAEKPRVFVLDFDGDMHASAVDNLREEITAVLSIGQASDEVVLKIESPGGVVHGYGLAASQLSRIKDSELSLTVCVDKVAASGGYMMACLADKLIAAPFAIVGSIGVYAQVTNIHRLLKKNDVDVEEMTAGEYKRTVSTLGEITDKGRQKFTEELEDTHLLFKEWVSQYRTQVDIEKIATGEIWYGLRALDQQLIDSLQTSDDYLLKKLDGSELYEVSYKQRKSLPERLGVAAEHSADRLLSRWWQRLSQRLFV